MVHLLPSQPFDSASSSSPSPGLKMILDITLSGTLKKNIQPVQLLSFVALCTAAAAAVKALQLLALPACSGISWQGTSDPGCPVTTALLIQPFSQFLSSSATELIPSDFDAKLIFCFASDN